MANTFSTDLLVVETEDGMLRVFQPGSLPAGTITQVPENFPGILRVSGDLFKARQLSIPSTEMTRQDLESWITTTETSGFSVQKIYVS